MTVPFRFRVVSTLTRLWLAGAAVLAMGGYTAGQQDKALAHLIKDQQNLLNRLQIFSEKLTRLSGRLDREGQAYAARLLERAHDYLSAPDAEDRMSLKDRMEAAKRTLEAEQLSEAQRAQARVLAQLQESLAILLDRQNLKKLEAELAEIRSALQDLDQLREDESRLLRETRGSSDPERATRRQKLKERIEALRGRQKKLMDQTAGRTPEEQAARNRLRFGLDELARDQDRLASALQEEELRTRARLDELNRTALQALEQYAETLRQAVQSTTDPTGQAPATNPTARNYARDQARRAVAAFQKAAGRGEAARKALDQAARQEEQADQSLANGSTAQARDAYRHALEAARQAAEQLKLAGARGPDTRALEQMGEEQARLEKKLDELARDLQEAGVPEAARSRADEARSAMEQARDAIRAHAEAARQQAGSRNGKTPRSNPSPGRPSGTPDDRTPGSSSGKTDGDRPEAAPRAAPAARSAAEALKQAARALARAEEKRLEATRSDRERVAREQQQLAEEVRQLEKELEAAARQEASAAEARPDRASTSPDAASTSSSSDRKAAASPSAQHAQEAARQMEQAASDLRQGGTAQARDRQREARHQLQKAREALEARGPSSADPAEARRELARWQKKLRDRAGELARKIDQIGQKADSPAEAARAGNRSEAVRRAERSMDRARRALDQGRMRQAEERQQEAVAALNQAEREIKKRERNYLDMAQEEVIFRVGEQLRTALGEQKSINERSVEEASKLDPKRPRMRRSVRRAFALLAKRQDKVKTDVERVIGKLEEEEIQVFLFLLNSIRDDMGRLTERLRQKPPDLSRLTRLMQADVVKNLQAILDTLETEAKRRRDERKSGKKPGTNDDEQQPGRKRLIPPTAELLMLKNYEVQVRERTDALHQAVVGQKPEQPVPDYVQNLLLRLAHQQGQVREVLKKFMKSLNMPVQDME